MSEIIKKEGSFVSFQLIVGAEEFDSAMTKVFQKNRNRYSIPGFRKGKVPMKLVESHYGEGIFYEDAINAVFPSAFEKAVEELELDVVSRPSIDVKEVGKGKDLELTVDVYVKPEVTLGEYKGLEVKKESAEVTEEELHAELDAMLEKNARIVSVNDRPVEDKDTVVLDYVGSVDGEEFEGGRAESYSLEIGSNSFIPGFEEQLIGMKLEEDKEIDVTFPEDYHSEDLKGKAAKFKVRIHEIKKKDVPVLDDDFVKDVSEFDTVEELREDRRKSLQENKEKRVESEFKNELVRVASENAQIEIPDVMIEEQIDNMVNDLSYNMRYQGLDLETYLQFTGQTLIGLREQMRSDAENRVKTALVLEAIVNAEGVDATDEDMEEEYKEMAKSYNMELDKLKEMMKKQDNEYLVDTIKNKKVIDIMMKTAK